MSEHGSIKFWTEIGRRNVLRVAAVYAGFAWFVIHSGVVMGEALELPHWIMRLVSALLIVGFPAVVAFAWVYEITPEGLKRSTEVEKDALIRALWEQNQALRRQVEVLTARVAELEARLKEPPKSSRNSSVPPSRDRKASKPERPPGARREASLGRVGGGRKLHPDPDQTVAARARRCPHCRAAVEASEQRPAQVYDRIELPPVRPQVTRIVLYGGRCRCCGRGFVAPAPVGLEPGSPLGRRAGGLSALHARHRLRTAGRAVRPSLRPRDQRRGAGQSSGARQAAVRRRGQTHPHAAASGAARLFR